MLPGMAAGGVCQEVPPSSVCMTRPPSPTSQALLEPVIRKLCRERRPKSLFCALCSDLRRIAATAPDRPTTTPVLESEKSPANQACSPAGGNEDQERPPSS